VGGRKFILCALVACGIAQNSQAGRNIHIGPHVVFGDGCPPGSVAIVLSDDERSLSVLFDRFQVDNGNKSFVSVKTCRIRVPVSQEANTATVIEQIDLRGFNDLPHVSRSRLNVEYGMGIRFRPVLNKVFNGPLDNEFIESVDLSRINARIPSRCGEQFELGLVINLSLLSAPRAGDALVALDSLDGRNGKVVYHLGKVKCR
jgi:hypothetical protein